jgi:quercetin dioxygenase-like cupin family protein
MYGPSGSAIEGLAPTGTAEVRVMQASQDMLMLHVVRHKGLIDPMHAHADHESVSYLISGCMRLLINDQEFIVEAGASWVHPAGVPHFSEALEDSEQLEIKSPPRKTWQNRPDPG